MDLTVSLMHYSTIMAQLISRGAPKTVMRKDTSLVLLARETPG
jgi:3-polyprenyl-4-hydroxybenzoate decarboxylase